MASKWDEVIYPGMKAAVINTMIATQERSESRKVRYVTLRYVTLCYIHSCHDVTQLSRIQYNAKLTCNVPIGPSPKLESGA